MENLLPVITRQQVILCLFDKFLLALGTGDGDFSLSPGDPHRLPAAGAIKVLMLPVLQPLQEAEVGPVFFVALVGVPGEHAQDRPDKKPVIQQDQNQIHRLEGDQKIENKDTKREPNQRLVQLVPAVATLHEFLIAGNQGSPQPPKPISDTAHKITCKE